MPTILGANTASTAAYEVDNSLRFEPDDNDHLERDPSSAGNRSTFTISFWMKISEVTTGTRVIINSNTSGNDYFIIRMENHKIECLAYNNGSKVLSFSSTQLLRDSSAWYNVIVAIDTTQGTESDRFKMYLNGTQITAFATSDYPSQNATMQWNNTENHFIGCFTEGTHNFRGYLCEIVNIDGSQLAPTSFGEFDDDSPNIWKPKSVTSLTFGTNGFYLNVPGAGTAQNSSGMGGDSSGNDHHFASSGLAANSRTTDTCTNNAVTFMSNTPSASNFTLSQGNLKIDKSGSGTFGLYGSSIMLSSGKWYWEVKMTGDAGSDRTRVGLAAYESVTGTSSIQGSYSGFEFTSVTSGRFSVTVDGSTTEIDGFNGYSTGDIIRFALDMDNTKLYVGRNADWFNYNSSNTGGDPTSGSGWVTNNATALAAPVTIYAGHAVGVSGSSELEFNFGASNTFSVSSGNSDGNGHGNFEYAVPSGYYAINSKNLAEYG